MYIVEPHEHDETYGKAAIINTFFIHAGVTCMEKVSMTWEHIVYHAISMWEYFGGKELLVAGGEEMRDRKEDVSVSDMDKLRRLR